MINSHGVTKKQTLHSISNVFKFRVISFNAYWKIRHGSFFFGGGGNFWSRDFFEFWFLPHSSSETQGQKVGARKSLSGRENIARRKVKKGEKSSWGQCLTRPVPNGRRLSGFWLVPDNFFSARLDFPSPPVSAPGSPRMAPIRSSLSLEIRSARPPTTKIVLTVVRYHENASLEYDD